jgi:DNA excision repair protein ERCC-2
MKYIVAVRALCEFTAKKGDLDLRFTPSPSAQEGIAGHATVASRRRSGYQAELSLSGEFGQLIVRGRADGYDTAQNQLEEIKTYRGDLALMPDNHRQLHWAQLRIYGHLLCRTLGLPEVRLALVYFDIGSQKETLLRETLSAEALTDYFKVQCECFLAWASQELAHRIERDRLLMAMRFPHESFRPGQRDLAEAVYKAASTGCCVLAQAPTGIGKTIGTLFPVLKASPKQELDKVFYLAAKTSGRRLALDALALIRQGEPALPLRVLELIARDKACEHPDKACHGESCPLAKGFYDCLPQARTAAIQATRAGALLDRNALREVALKHQVCPYYLGQDLVRWADVIVGDYNYYFDISAMLYNLSINNQWRISVLVDEAHNMIERARKMYSAELDQAGFRLLRKTAPDALKRILDRVNRAWNALFNEQSCAYQAYPDIPEKFLSALQHASGDIAACLADHPTQVDGRLQQFYFDALHFCRLAEVFGQHSLFDITKPCGETRRNGAILCIRNTVPAPFLAQRFAAARSTALFSATLSPWHYYSDMLGLPDGTVWIDVESPFAAQQLSVQVARRISTRFQDRDDSLSPIVDLVAAQYKKAPGNYLAFFSSYDYLQSVNDLFRLRFPDIPVWEQTRRMEEGEREQFLARFTHESRGIGFAVLGGAFAEGIDLPGRRLIGAFIATLGLPQMNPVNEQIMRRIDDIFGNGYDYAYLFPGIQKVVQAAGRVIRTQQDEGIVFLIDDRFARPEVLRLLPGWWKIGK